MTAIDDHPPSASGATYSSLGSDGRVEAAGTAPVGPVTGIVMGARQVADVESAAAAAFDAHAAALAGFARAAVRDQDAADDLVQECFLRLVSQLRAGRPPDNVRAWLFRVCANLAISQGRRGSVRDRALAILVDRWSSPSPEAAVIQKDDDATLRRGLDRLRQQERLALLLSASGLSAAEVGQAIGRTPNATRVFLFRSRRQLRDALTEEEVAE